MMHAMNGETTTHLNGRARLRIASLALIVLLPIFAPAAGTPEDLLRDADQLEKAGSLQQAADHYLEFLKKYPDHSQITEANYRLAKCYDTMGLVDESMAALKTTLDAGSKTFRNRADAAYMLGKFQASLKNHADAVATFEKLLAEGPGLYEDEALLLCGTYYTILDRYDDAAAKLNILKRKSDSPLSEQAGFRLAALWLKAGKTDRAVDAIQDFVQQYPKNRQIPELLLRAADLYRTQKKLDKTIALCEQLKSAYPASLEAVGAGYILGLSLRDNKEPRKAVDALEKTARNTDPQGRELAAEAMLGAAEITLTDMSDTAKAMERYAEAAKLARDSTGERRGSIMEQCYFHLAEYHYQRKNWSVALENYLLLRALNPKLDLDGRLSQCQFEMNRDKPSPIVTDTDIGLIREKIKTAPGTREAAEADVFLADRSLSDALQRNTGFTEAAAHYERILHSYSNDVLSPDSLQSYVYAQIGTAYARCSTTTEWTRAATAFESAAAAGTPDSNPYRISSLENLASVSDRLGDKPRTIKTYTALLAITRQKLDANKGDLKMEGRALDYLRSIVTRTDTGDVIQQALDLCAELIEKQGQLSELSREARFSMAELYYLRKDYSAAAKGFQDFIRIYGPPQTAEGDIRDYPWRPDPVDDKADRLYEAALRIAHCWSMQGHGQNMVKAYEWMVRNVPHKNPRIAEARYWLAIEAGKGERASDKAGKRRLAESLWTNVVNTCVDFDSPALAKSYWYWADPRDPAFVDCQRYVKPAMLKAGQAFSDTGDHVAAARIFEQFLERYPLANAQAEHRKRKRARDVPYDEMSDTARYALAREFIALRNLPKAIRTLDFYLNDFRDSPLRVSALKLLGFHAATDGQVDVAAEAYSTLLDEYGATLKNEQGVEIPVPMNERLRQGRTNWDGLRMAPPPDLDAGEIRYYLGHLYWKQTQWAKCAKALESFLDAPALARNPSRDKALYMCGQSYYKLADFANGVRQIGALIREYPKFEAIEEAYVNATLGYAKVRRWDDVDFVYRKFLAEWPRSDRRPRMDLYGALSLMAQGQDGKGIANLKGLIEGDTFEDVKAEAAFEAGRYYAALKKPEFEIAARYFEKSVATLPREAACLEAARCYIQLRQWAQARQMLDRLIRDFPKGDQGAIEEGRALMPQVLREFTKQQGKRDTQ